jgi:recombination protein RecA
MKSMDSKLKEAIDALNKNFGPGSIVLGSEMGKVAPLPRIKTGIFGLDISLGGGLPKGRIIEAFGPLSSGKTLLAIMTAKSIQDEGGVVAWIDLEHQVDRTWMERLGVNTGHVLFSEPENCEQAIDIIDTLVRSRTVALVVIDSIAAFSTIREQEEGAADQQMGDTAKLVNKLMRKLTSALQAEDLSKPETYNNCLVFAINQEREKIGVMYGNPITTPGGRGLPFFASIRINMHVGEYLKDKEEIIGKTIKFKIEKNKTFPPKKVGEFDLYNDGTIDNEKSIILYGITSGLIIQSGPYYSYEGVKYQGKEKLIDGIKGLKKIGKLKEDILNFYVKQAEVKNDEK